MEFINLDVQFKLSSVAMWQVFLLIFLLLSCFASFYRVYLRLFKTNIVRFFVVISLNFSAVVAISALLLEPEIISDNNQYQTATLITTIVNPANKTDHNNNIYYLAEQAQTSIKNNDNVINSANQILIRQPNLSQLQIKGHGLYQPQWQAFKSIALSFTPAKITAGISEIHWQQRLVLGQPLIIQAQFFSPDQPSDKPANAVIKLIDLAGKELISQTVKANKVFSLKTQPKAQGQYQYYLELSSTSGQLIDRQTLYVDVHKGRNIKLMVIQSSPSFESKQLAQWAGEHGAEVIIHTQISKNKFIDKRVNVDSDLDINFSSELLASQDLLVIDGRAFVALSAIQQQQLQQAIHHGLGLLVLADQSFIDLFEQQKPRLFTDFNLTKKVDITEPVYPKWLNSELFVTHISLPLLAANLSINVGNVVVSGDSLPLLVSSPAGVGQKAISILRENFRWLTQGEVARYSHFWQNIFIALSRPNQSSTFIDIDDTEIKMVHQAQKVCLRSQTPKLELKIKHQDNEEVSVLPLNQNQKFTQQYCAFYWPEASGWYRFTLRNTENNQLIEQKNLYVYSLKDWQSWQQYQKVTGTKAFIKQYKSQPKMNNEQVNFEKIAAINFWWLLIISACLLWLETKIPIVMRGLIK